MASRQGSLFLPALLCHSGPLRPFKHSETLSTKSKLTARCCYSGSFLRTPPLRSCSPALLLSGTPCPSSLSVLGTFLSYGPSRQTLACSAAQSTRSQRRLLLLRRENQVNAKKKEKKSLWFVSCKIPAVRVLQQQVSGCQQTELSQHTPMKNIKPQSSSIRSWTLCDVIKKTCYLSCPLVDLSHSDHLVVCFCFRQKLKQVETGGCKQRAN